MKVNNPRFDSGTVTCLECPFTDEYGYCEPDEPCHGLCTAWGRNHDYCCPSVENYFEACRLAEEVKNANH